MAAGILGNIGYVRTVPILVVMFKKETTWNVLEPVSDTLVKLGEPAVQPLIPNL